MYNPLIHHRRSIRLKGYDYSKAGLYFITLCCQNREHLFGEIKNGEMIFNDAGNMVNKEWLALTRRFTNIQLHEYQLMPNHFHSIIEIIDIENTNGNVGATLVVATNGNRQPQGLHQQPQPVPQPLKKTVGDIIGAFKSITTDEYIVGVKTLGWSPFNKKVWQRDYFEHIIRDEQEYFRITEYIINNPKSWKTDKLK